jgi:hypothetical protein
MKIYLSHNSEDICTIINMTSNAQSGTNVYNNKDNAYDTVYCRTPSYSNIDANLNNNQAKPIKSGSFTYLKIKMDNYNYYLNESQFRFEYVDDPKIYSIEPESTIASGGIEMKIIGKDFDNAQSINLILSGSNLFSNHRGYTIDALELKAPPENSKLEYVFKSV